MMSFIFGLIFHVQVLNIEILVTSNVRKIVLDMVSRATIGVSRSLTLFVVVIFVIIILFALISRVCARCLQTVSTF